MTKLAISYIFAMFLMTAFAINSSFDFLFINEPTDDYSFLLPAIPIIYLLCDMFFRSKGEKLSKSFIISTISVFLLFSTAKIKSFYFWNYIIFILTYCVLLLEIIPKFAKKHFKRDIYGLVKYFCTVFLIVMAAPITFIFSYYGEQFLPKIISQTFLHDIVVCTGFCLPFLIYFVAPVILTAYAIKKNWSKYINSFLYNLQYHTIFLLIIMSSMYVSAYVHRNYILLNEFISFYFAYFAIFALTAAILRLLKIFVLKITCICFLSFIVFFLCFFLWGDYTNRSKIYSMILFAIFWYVPVYLAMVAVKIWIFLKNILKKQPEQKQPR